METHAEAVKIQVMGLTCQKQANLVSPGAENAMELTEGGSHLM